MNKYEALLNVLLPLLNYIEATPEEGLLPGEFQIIKFRAFELRNKIRELEVITQ